MSGLFCYLGPPPTTFSGVIFQKRPYSPLYTRQTQNINPFTFGRLEVCVLWVTCQSASTARPDCEVKKPLHVLANSDLPKDDITTEKTLYSWTLQAGCNVYVL